MAVQIQGSNGFHKWLARAVNWKEAIGWLVAGSTVMSGLASQIAELAQYGWAAIALVGIVLACICFPLVMGGMAIWRAYKPRSGPVAPEVKYLPELDHPPAAYDDSVLRTEIADVMAFAEAAVEELSKEAAAKAEQLKKLVLESSNLQTERYGLIRQQLTALAADIKAARDYAEGSVAGAGHNFGELQAAQAEAGKEFASFKLMVERALENTWEKLELRCKSIDQGFMAILDRENLLALATEIEAVGDDLSGPTKGEQIADWPAWFKRYQAWRRTVKNWARIAGEHRQDVDGRVFETTEEDYRGTWEAKDSYFPDATAVQDYKTFRIVLRNFHAERSHVDSCVRMDAFVSPSTKGRVYPSPRDADQMPRTQR